VCRRDQVDIVAAHPLESDHPIRDIVVRDHLAFSFVGNGPILAKDAPQITVGKKNGSRSVTADEGYFLSKVGVGTEKNGLGRCPAEAFFAGEPVDTAFSWTETALLEKGIGLFHTTLEFPRMLQPVISGAPVPGVRTGRRQGGGFEKDRPPDETCPMEKLAACQSHGRVPWNSRVFTIGGY
jgi:hypothetical protein